jgi:hypothetical protein
VSGCGSRTTATFSIHPALGKFHVEGGQSCGVGAVRHCEMKMAGF